LTFNGIRRLIANAIHPISHWLTDVTLIVANRMAITRAIERSPASPLSDHSRTIRCAGAHRDR
jgi:hypothetical protein